MNCKCYMRPVKNKTQNQQIMICSQKTILVKPKNSKFLLDFINVKGVQIVIICFKDWFLAENCSFNLHSIVIKNF